MREVRKYGEQSKTGIDRVYGDLRHHWHFRAIYSPSLQLYRRDAGLCRGIIRASFSFPEKKQPRQKKPLAKICGCLSFPMLSSASTGSCCLKPITIPPLQQPPFATICSRFSSFCPYALRSGYAVVCGHHPYGGGLCSVFCIYEGFESPDHRHFQLYRPYRGDFAFCLAVKGKYGGFWRGRRCACAGVYLCQRITGKSVMFLKILRWFHVYKTEKRLDGYPFGGF